jgi:hypothetical protein
MKTAISVPDKVFKAAERKAHDLGISQDELFTRAVIEFLKEKKSDVVTRKLNEIYKEEESGLSEEDTRLQEKSLDLSEEEW